MQLFFNSVLRPFQDYFSSYETGQSVGGRNGRTPRKNTWHTRKQNLACKICKACGLYRESNDEGTGCAMAMAVIRRMQKGRLNCCSFKLLTNGCRIVQNIACMNKQTSPPKSSRLHCTINGGHLNLLKSFSHMYILH